MNVVEDNASIANIEDMEYNLLLESINLRYGHDLTTYSTKSLKRRLLHHVEKIGYKKLSDLIKPVLYDETFFEDLLNSVSVPVTEMFRDPMVFQALRDKVLPLLKTYPTINIWHAGCCTGEEVYSMAIMLEEAGLYENCHIYATDFSSKSLNKAKLGIYSYSHMQQYTENYYAAGGINSFSDYYHSHDDGIKINESLSRNITFAKHNLANDSAFGQFNLILCRNVLIYFNKELQDRVCSLFYESTLPLGYLCLGSHEALNNSHVNFETIFDKYKIYRKQK